MAEFDLSLVPALSQPSSLLPIAKHKQSLIYTVEKYPVTIIIGQTGSGKTTQLPQFLAEAGWCKNGKVIGVTQPRRIAATSVASRVAEEMKCQVGEDVGYSIRFEDVTTARTKIKFLTDGMLLREALVDPLLSRYSVIMVDEAHERSLSSDVLLGLLKKIQKRRPELKIIVSSATIDAERFSIFFTTGEDDEEKCRMVSIEGRAHPVDILYLDQPSEDYLEKAIQSAYTIHTQEPEGDILVFLTGRDEIDKAMQKLSEMAATLRPGAQALQPLPLFAGLSTADQMYVFSPAAENNRKCILSTNIAEASVTIPGIVYVIDTGFVKLRAYNPTTNIESLTPVPISKASATQRAGRAGRTRPGKCFRLYTQTSYTSFLDTTIPEIQRSNLAPLVLQLKALGIDNIVRFDFLTPPPSALLIRAFEQLYSLGAIDDYAKLTTPLGTRMSELSLPPMTSKALLSSSTPQFSCLPELLTIGAMTSLQGNVFYHDDHKQTASSRRTFAAEEGDHLTLLNIYTAFTTKGRKDPKWCHTHGLNHKSLTRAVSIRNQLYNSLKRLGINIPDQSSNSRAESKNILRCLTSGFFANAAKFNVADGTYRSVSGNVTLHAHPSSVLFNRKAEYVVFSEILETGDKVYIKDVSKVEKKWLEELSGGYYKVTETGR